MSDLLDRLRAINAETAQRDPDLADELGAVREEESVRVADDDGLESVDLEGAGIDPDNVEMGLESIVYAKGHPVLAILRDEAQLKFANNTDSDTWAARLTSARAKLINAARSVGRIELTGHRLAWVGTGWLVADDTLVTNRHVAQFFGEHDGTGFVFRQARVGRVGAAIDFLEEIDRADELTFSITEILYIEDHPGADLAFLRVDQIGGDNPPSPIALATEPAEVDDFVAVIGYPARDPYIPDVALMDQLYGNVYDKKRLAPGQVMPPRGGLLCHGATTLGGNSGSVVLSLASGDAVGLHFAGKFAQANYAVPSRTVAQRLEQMTTGRLRPNYQEAPPPPPPTPAAPSAAVSPTRITTVIPLRITVEIGTPYSETAVPEDDFDLTTEARPEDYADREGYDAAFLPGFDVPLPELTADRGDILTFGDGEQILKYQHFSVLMSRSRRMCRYSAVNIDGMEKVKIDRPAWRTDPRIPTTAQIKDECYGNAPKFARGHMTRREDPIWGTDETRRRGNSDSMHVTNAVPQMQTFNGGVWLRLEDYALDHARRDDMHICVFTGPFLERTDPVKFGVKVPVEFWKVIAFIHDKTGKLCATGYTMSQRKFFTDEEFVFGAHGTDQTSIASIERRAGLSFGDLVDVDAFIEPEGVAVTGTPLRTVHDITFV